jgi:hypothetical protein
MALMRHYIGIIHKDRISDSASRSGFSRLHQRGEDAGRSVANGEEALREIDAYAEEHG